MEINLPTTLGSIYNYKDKNYILDGISWFRWSWGMEYTYFLAKDDPWHNHEFILSKGEGTYRMDIADTLLTDGFFADKGYPLKGKGYLMGIHWERGKLFADMILTDKYNMHLRIECDEHGNYVENGEILWPPTPSFETEEKRTKYIRKR